MSRTTREPAYLSPRLRPSCYRCGSPLTDSPVVSCPRCVERPRRPIGASLLRLARFRLRTVLVLVALVAVALAWGVHAWRRRLADNAGQFRTHEEETEYQAFLKSVALDQARQAELKAAAGGDHRQRWTEEAASWRTRASAHARAEAEYR
jgi:hypothetical protein